MENQETFKPEQLVWAKIRGYPWWPAIVNYTQVTGVIPSSKKQEVYTYRVHFIGENSQQVLRSAYLKFAEIADFDAQANEYSKNKLKVSYSQSLQNSVTIAYKYHQGEINFSDITKINESLTHRQPQNNSTPKKAPPAKVKQPKPEPPPTKRRRLCSKSPVKKPQMTEADIIQIQTLQTIVNNKQETLEDAPSDSELESVKECLKESIQKFAAEKAEPETGDMQNLIQVLTRLVHLNLTADQIEESKLPNLVKLLKDEIMDNHEPFLQESAKLCRKLINIWKKLVTCQRKQNKKKSYAQPAEDFDEEYIADKVYRNQLCRKIAQVLEENMLERDNARSLALKIELNLRMRDQNMSDVYRNLARRMLKEIRHLSAFAYESYVRDASKYI